MCSGLIVKPYSQPAYQSLMEVHNKPLLLHLAILLSKYSITSDPPMRLDTRKTTLVNAGKNGPESSSSMAIQIAVVFVASALRRGGGIQIIRGRISNLMEVKVLGILDRSKGNDESSSLKDCVSTQKWKKNPSSNTRSPMLSVRSTWSTKRARLGCAF